MQLVRNLANSIKQNDKRYAFYIGDTYFTYNDLAKSISKIRHAIRFSTKITEKNIGLVINDDLETYASIIALWFEGRAYVPLSPDNPEDRNKKIIQQADINSIFDSSDNILFPNYNIIESKKLPDVDIDLLPANVPESDLAYIFFTSGTTGEPKGVPIMRSNVSGFIDAFWDMGFEISDKDRVLQMFELTFDLSVMSYLVPLLKGACVYTIPKNVIKYNYIFELMDEHHITVALMVPSILHYLRPYFEEIDAPDMRYSLFCGEALPLDVTKEWSVCLPNAEISNVYGPTENTIFCTSYNYNRNSHNKENNGVLCIGKAMNGVTTVIVDENNNILSRGEKGELCLAGKLLTPGYWKNEVKNKEAFFVENYNNEPIKFYKTGDLCVEDNDGDILYLGRIDFQTQIQGFRVELSEVEFHVKAFLNKVNAVALAIKNKIGNTEIGLAIESEEFDTKELLASLKTKMPTYMLPTQLKFFKKFPLNTNGKTDRKALIQKF